MSVFGEPQDRILHGDEQLAGAVLRDLARPDLPAATAGGCAMPRIDADPESAERGLARLVLAVVEIVRQLLERQAIRRVEAGSLTDEQVERVGRALMALEERMTTLCEVFGVEPDDLALPAGSLGGLEL